MENLITCKICGKQSTRIYGAHLKSHGITSNDYKEMFPGEPLYTESDNKETSKNSGKHMKEEKYKKMFSEKIKGGNNPNCKSKTTEEERKNRSPFSKNFIKYSNENEALEFSKKVNDGIKPENRPNNIEYWINKGYSKQESIEIISKKQNTFSLEKCIEKYGEEVGKEIWLKRQEKWMKNYKKSNFSSISQKLFWTIYEKLDNKDEIYFATIKDERTDFSGGNNEYHLKLKNIIISPDFFDKNKNKIIEFDGTYYHRENPENRKRLLKRDEEIIDGGFQVLHISEYDYKKNPDKVISDCLEFLNK